MLLPVLYIALCLIASISMFKNLFTDFKRLWIRAAMVLTTLSNFWIAYCIDQLWANHGQMPIPIIVTETVYFAISVIMFKQSYKEHTLPPILDITEYYIFLFTLIFEILTIYVSDTLTIFYTITVLVLATILVIIRIMQKHYIDALLDFAAECTIIALTISMPQLPH